VSFASATLQLTVSGAVMARNEDTSESLPAMVPTASIAGVSQPVRLFSDGEDPHRRWLYIKSFDQVGLLFKLFEVLRSQNIDICSAEIQTEDGVANNRFELYTSTPSDFTDATDWCRELEEYLANPGSHREKMLQGSLDSVMRKLSVNSDLLSVVTFQEICIHEGPPDEYRYKLEIQGINQAGLLTFAAVIFFRSGFNVLRAKISTVEGHVTDMFELSTNSPDAEKKLGSFLDLPVHRQEGGKFNGGPMPFHATASDGDLGGLCAMWHTKYGGTDRPFSPCSSFSDDVMPNIDEKETVWTAGREGDHRSYGGAASSSMHRPGEEGDNSETLGRVASRIDGAVDVEEPSDLGSPRLSQAGSYTNAAEVANGASQGARQSGANGSRITGTAQTMSVNFENGDMYTGSSVLFDSGEKRHGYGTYYYSDATHPSYKQYQGEWKEDQKHGYGVLFLKKGGVYVGQWQANKRHGLGVMHESHDDRQTAMPCYRYEGQWVEDEPHGLGVEENRDFSYFGRFAHGKAQGRGIRMHHKRLEKFQSCQLLDGETEIPLKEAMRTELRKLAPFRPRDDTTPSNGGESHRTEPNHQDAQEDFESWPQVDRYGGQTWGAESSESSSAKTSSAETKAVATPLMHRPHAGEIALPGSPLDSVTPELNAARSALLAPGRPTRQTTPVGGGEMVFAMMEENNLISPDVVQHHRGPLPQVGEEEAMADDPNAQVQMEITIQQQQPGGRTGGLPARSQSASARPLEDLRSAVSAPVHPTGDGAGLQDSETQPRSISSAAFDEGALERRICSPMLWSEEELAAFVACLGISYEVSRRILHRKLKGVMHFLELSNSELRRDFNLTSPVERLMLRQSLKWLLDADRWENCVHGQKIGDILKDSVLSQHVIPFEEVTLHGKLSQGGYGMVYRGVLQPRQNRGNPHVTYYAEKVYPIAAKEMKGERRARLYELLKEACIMATLHHPNVCNFIGVSADATARKHYIISELMDCSLHDLVHQPYKLRWHGELTVSLVVNLSTGISAGIVYLHSMKLVHADLKSSNILISYSMSWEPIPRLCDFGHAAMRSFPSPHHRCGTPHWAAPEVLRSEALGPAADVYSFGVIVWEMLTQRIPHKGLSFGQVLAAVGWAGWGPDLKLLPEIPQDLRRLIKMCLRFVAAERPSSAEVQKKLRRIPRRARLSALANLLSFVGGACSWCS